MQNYNRNNNNFNLSVHASSQDQQRQPGGGPPQHSTGQNLNLQNSQNFPNRPQIQPGLMEMSANKVVSKFDQRVQSHTNKQQRQTDAFYEVMGQSQHLRSNIRTERLTPLVAPPRSINRYNSSGHLNERESSQISYGQGLARWWG